MAQFLTGLKVVVGGSSPEVVQKVKKYRRIIIYLNEIPKLPPL